MPLCSGLMLWASGLRRRYASSRRRVRCLYSSRLPRLRLPSKKKLRKPKRLKSLPPPEPAPAPPEPIVETPAAVLPEPSPAPAVEAKAKIEEPKPKPVPEKKKKAKKEKKKARPKPPVETLKKNETPPPAQDTPEAQTAPEPEKELVIGKGHAPSYARFLPPDYPPRARRQNIEGSVLLRVLVDREGRAAEITVVESSHPEFTRAAQKSARRSRYVPMKRLGQPVEAWVLIPFHFKLR